MKKLFAIILFFALAQPAFADNITVYPEAHLAVTAGDGNVNNNTTGQTWAQKRDGAGVGVINNTAQMHFWKLQDNTTNTWQALIRSIFNFDTSALGAGATISSSTLSLSGNEKANGNNISPSFSISTSTPASKIQVATGDYNSMGNTAMANTITYANLSGTTYNRWTFNAAGLAEISKTGVSSFTPREMSYDAPNTAPTWYGDGAQAYFYGDTADQTGTANDPELSIDYTAGAAITTLSQESDFLIFE